MMEKYSVICPCQLDDPDSQTMIKTASGFKCPRCNKTYKHTKDLLDETVERSGDGEQTEVSEV